MFNYVSSSNNIWGGWQGLKTELHRFFRNAKPHAAGVLKKQSEKVAAASNSDVVHTFNARTNKWSEEKSSVPPTMQANSPFHSNPTPSQISGSASMESKTPSSSDSNLRISDDRKTLGSAESASVKKGTLQEMFKRQSESEGCSSSSFFKAKKVHNAPNTLKEMFEKQQAAASAAHPTPTPLESMDVDDSEQGLCNQPSEQQANVLAMNSFSFKRSPFANEMLTPTSEVASGTSQIRLAGVADLARAEEDEHLCVVCEESKKQVMLLPCKHMCLCKGCAAECLFKTLHECPMCRAKIENSMEVYW
jgi:hypothetical protein